MSTRYKELIQKVRTFLVTEVKKKVRHNINHLSKNVKWEIKKMSAHTLVRSYSQIFIYIYMGSSLRFSTWEAQCSNTVILFWLNCILYYFRTEEPFMHIFLRILRIQQLEKQNNECVTLRMQKVRYKTNTK